MLEHGTNAIVVEADWPDAWRVDRYIRGESDDRDATRLPTEFDAMIHIDATRAVEPLVPEPAWQAGEPAETYPTGL